MSARTAIMVVGLLGYTIAQAEDQSRIVAVLPLDHSTTVVSEEARRTFEESLRTVAGDLLGPLGLTVLAGETTLRLLEDNGVNLNKVCESTCALSAAREMKAVYFLGGSINFLEDRYVVFVRLYETRLGQQIGGSPDDPVEAGNA